MDAASLLVALGIGFAIGFGVGERTLTEETRKLNLENECGRNHMGAGAK